MAALTCEICGGKLIGKPGGVFECDSCGMEYSTEWAKAKIQEIKGTVKVEGTVQVEGTVKVDGSVKVEGGVNKDALLKRGNLALEDGKWQEALKHFDQALDADAECAEAYLGKLLAGMGLYRVEDLETWGYADYLDKSDYKNALRFAGKELKTILKHAERTNIAIRDKEEAECKRELSEKIQKLDVARKRAEKAQRFIAAGKEHTIGLKIDGTVVAAGDDKYGQCDVSSWTDVIAVAAGCYHTIGLKSDGSVLAVGHADGCNVSSWENIVAIAAGYFHTVGLKDNGTVVAVGRNYSGQCEVSDWKDIVDIVAGGNATVGKKSDGSMLQIGNYISDDYSNPVDWYQAVAISIGFDAKVGLREDGTVFPGGRFQFPHDKERLRWWTDVVAIATNDSQTLGVQIDGSIVGTGKDIPTFIKWAGNDFVAVSAGVDHVVALAPDGTMRAWGYNKSGQCDVSKWKLFNNFDTIEEDRDAAMNAAEEARRKKIAALTSEQSSLQTELANLKGMFSGNRRKKIEARMAEITQELSKLRS